MALVSKEFGDLITFTRSTGGGRFNAAGQYEWLPADQPRIDYNPVTGECLGLLIEEQRTNLLTYSSDFANAAWLGNVNKLDEFTVAPDGLETARKIAAATNLDIHSHYRNVTVPSGSVVSSSFFLKAGEYRYAQVSLDSVGRHNRGFITVDLETGSVIRGPKTIGAGNRITRHSVESVGSGWFRCSITSDGSQPITAAAVFLIEDGREQQDTPEYQGDGTSGIYIWGAQLEAGAFPTSYIPTTDAQVTRAADIATVNELSPWYNPEQGTLVVESSAAAVSPQANTSVSLTDGTTYNRIIVGQFHAQTRIGSVGVANVDQALFHIPPVSLNQPHKFALAWASNNFAASVDGATPLTDSVGSIPSVTVMKIGALNTVQWFCGHIRSIRYYPRRLSDSELQAMTA